MTDPQDLYQAEILEHDENPRNEGRLDDPTASARVSNPLCGDRVQVDLQIEDGVIRDIRFKGRGCAISRASASMMTELVQGLPADEAAELEAKIQQWLDSEARMPPEGLERLEPLGAVRAFPSRKRCATLAWSSLTKALNLPRP
ncbi:MAG: Fe-S cluster assembly sulfur transfer protein SufU [Myxococcota bacterium]